MILQRLNISALGVIGRFALSLLGMCKPPRDQRKPQCSSADFITKMTNTRTHGALFHDEIGLIPGVNENGRNLGISRFQFR